MNKTKYLVAAILVASLTAVACSNDPEPAPEPTSVLLAVPADTATPEPTPIPEPTATPEPTAIPEPTPTPEPTATVTPEPPDVLFRYMAGVNLLSAAQYDEAVSSFDMVIRVLPEMAKAYHYRGLAHYNKERFELALEDFIKAIELKPVFPEAFMNRGVLHLNQGNLSQGIKDLEEAIRLFENQGNLFAAAEAQSILLRAIGS
ncbi:MAG: tetratricopeptide repeat protein [SAR202 cluster bacterium]|nr:tetratricopeptide repeat protein [SAR202 cluster bacterium]